MQKANKKTSKCKSGYSEQLLRRSTFAITLLETPQILLCLMKAASGAVGNNIRNFAFNCFVKLAYRNKYLTRAINSKLTKMADEEEKALAAAGKDENGDSIFGKIARKEMKVDIVYEDDKVLAFNDINPQAPVHILVIPKIRDGLTRLSKAEERHKEILGHMMWAVAEIVREKNLGDFRLVANEMATRIKSQSGVKKKKKEKAITTTTRLGISEVIAYLQVSTNECLVMRTFVSVISNTER
ncbi:protein kinase C inhibitor [Plasmodium ovale curtisi]|uniref:Protein kinase C inhibitor n=1 Tax=Plasmodium ovale curtisi TaxID=864141 RepID=A0A1A8WN13_PLAOA|nr:protein kinase C inhibitor [Plasmodium ovale curtisi]